MRILTNKQVEEYFTKRHEYLEADKKSPAPISPKTSTTSYPAINSEHSPIHIKPLP